MRKKHTYNIKRLKRNLKKYSDSLNVGESIDKSELKNLLKKLKTKKIPEQDIAHLISLFGNNMFLEAKDEVEKYLYSENGIVRYNVLSALILDWGYTQYYTVVKKILLNDPDEDVRGMAASCIGSIKRGTWDIDALGILLMVFKNENETWLVRDLSYHSILDVVGIPREKQPKASRILDYKKDVDWDLIHKIEKRVKI